MINQEYIQNQVCALGCHDFDIVIQFLLNDLFSQNVVNVNGKGDGGCDLRHFACESDSCLPCLHGERLGCQIIQVTVQDRRWQVKALNDAKKACENFKDVKFFLFFTSRNRSLVELSKLEKDIKEQTNVYDARCYGAREIAGYIFEHHAFEQLWIRLGRSLPENVMGRPDSKLVFLHTLYAFHKDRGLLRNEVYDAVILNGLYQSAKTKQELMDYVASFLARKGRDKEIERRIDSLQTGKVTKNGDVVSLTEQCRLELKTANECFAADLMRFKEDVISILHSHCAVEGIDEAVSFDLALNLAKIFVSTQCNLLNTASCSKIIPVPLNFGGELEINRFLIELRIPRKSLGVVKEALIEVASRDFLVRRLVDAVAYAWTDYGQNFCSVLALGQYDWKNVEVILDANVAMPYFLSQWFAPTSDRYSEAINSTVKILRERGCRISVPNVYLSECAGHLFEALKYRTLISGNEEILKHSENAFVAHYCQMCELNIDRPKTFEEYLKNVCSSILLYDKSWDEGKKFRFESIREKFVKLQIVSFPRYSSKISDDVRHNYETEYSYLMKEAGTERRSLLMEHDISVLTSLEAHGDCLAKILLTNDNILRGIANKKVNSLNDRLVISPADAFDILQTSEPISDEQLKSVALTVASVSCDSENIAAKFFDRLLAYANNEEPMWKREGMLVQLKDEYMRTHSGANDLIQDAAKQAKIDEFLREKGFKFCPSDEKVDVEDV